MSFDNNVRGKTMIDSERDLSQDEILDIQQGSERGWGDGNRLDCIIRWLLARFPRPLVVGGIVVLIFMTLAGIYWFHVTYNDMFWNLCLIGLLLLFGLIGFILVDAFLPKREKKD